MIELKNLLIPGYSPVNLTLAEAECVAISGASGSGKTRLLRAIADMDEHDGEVLINGVSALSMPASEWRKKAALLPAESLWWFDRVGEHFQFYHRYFPALGFTEEVMDWEVARCSSGEKQRLSLLRLLQNEPQLLLLDEPTANLDSDNTAKVEALIKQYLQQTGASAIWVGHSESQLIRMARRQFVMVNGKMVDSAGSELSPVPTEQKTGIRNG